MIIGGDAGTQKDIIISVDDWRRFIMPRLRNIWDVYKMANIPIIHHSCGNILKVILYMIDIGLDVLHPIQHVMEPEILKQRFGKYITFFGGIDTQKLLPFGTPKEIQNEVKNRIEILGKGGGYIIAPDQCIMSDVPVKNILALVDAINKYSPLPFN